MTEQAILNDIINDDNSIVITTDSGFFQFGTYINQSKVYTDVNGFYGIKNNQIEKLFDYKLVSKDDFKKIVNDNSNKTIYIIEPSWKKMDLSNRESFNEIHHIPNSGFTLYSLNQHPI